MFYVFCPRPSQGARELTAALEGRRLRHFDGIDFWDNRKKTRLRFDPTDVIVCWGHPVPPHTGGARILNESGPTCPRNKLDELMRLTNAGVPCVSAAKIDHDGSLDIYRKGGYLIRSLHHQGGSDMLNGTLHPAYVVKKLEFTTEFRVHSFNGKSIRAGQKVLREGFTALGPGEVWRPGSGKAHPWVRSYDSGWKVSYDGFESTTAHRTLAHKAVKALGLVFGAVDLGKTPQGNLVVIEVNTAPGIEGGSIASYARAITKWAQGDVVDAPPVADPRVEVVIAKPGLRPERPQPNDICPRCHNQYAIHRRWTCPDGGEWPRV
jgi:hypothetical protein